MPTSALLEVDVEVNAALVPQPLEQSVELVLAGDDARTDPARAPEQPDDEPTQADETPRASDPDKPGDVAASARPAAAPEPAPQGAATFTQARTAHEIAKAQRARIQVQRLREEVVDRAQATAEVFRLARRERDAWVTWPARVAALMAAELGLDAPRHAEGLGGPCPRSSQ